MYVNRITGQTSLQKPGSPAANDPIQTKGEMTVYKFCLLRVIKSHQSWCWHSLLFVFSQQNQFLVCNVQEM